MQRYFSEIKNDDKFILSSDDIYHIKTVMRMKDKDEIIVVNNEIPYLCYIDKDEIKIKKELEQKQEVIPYTRIIIPLLKEQKIDYIIQKATELGVSEIVFYEAKRSIIKINEKIDKKIIRWGKIAKEASEQSNRTTIPKIKGVYKINDLKDLDGVKLLCSTKENDKNFKNILNSLTNCDRINLVIGPEGGVDPKEEELLNNFGYESITLGNRILRVETVPLFLMSVINYEFME